MKRNWLSLTACLFALVGALAPSLAQETVALPKGADVLSKYRDATGGMEKYKALTGMIYKGTLKVPEAGIEGSIVIRYQKPDKLRVERGTAGNWNDATRHQRRCRLGNVAHWRRQIDRGRGGEALARVAEHDGDPVAREDLQIDQVYGS